MATAIHQYEDKLLDFAYGELPAPEASAVESHLKSCVRCTQALAQIRGVRASMSVLPTLAAPDAGLESLMAYAEQAAARNAVAAKVVGPPWWRRAIAPLAGVLALSLVVVVAYQTEKDGGLDDLSKQAAIKESEAAKTTRAAPPAPVAAAAPQQEEAEAKAEPTVWEPGKANKDALAKNSEGYEQQLGATRSAEENRQRAQKADLGDVLKQSKTRRDQDFDSTNARGGYVREKELDKKKAMKPAPANDKLAAVSPNETDNAYGLSTKSPAPPPPPQAQPAPAPQVVAKEAPAPKAQVAQREEAGKGEQAPAEKPADARPSLSFGLGNAGPSGSSSGGYTGGGTGTKPGTLGTRKNGADSSDDELAGRGASSIADTKRLKDDEQSRQAALEHDARPHLDAARAAGNQSNHQEEVKQALYVLNTGVKGVYRAEALSRLCNTLTELGNEGQADKYCDALLTEFPNTAAARVVATRRANMQGGPKATAKKSAPANYDEAERAAEPSPAKAKKAADQAAPAATSY